MWQTTFSRWVPGGSSRGCRDDEGGRILTNYLAEAGADVEGVVVDRDRPTTRKTRIWASHRHQLVRVDLESRKKVSGRVARDVMHSICSALKRADAVLVSDYDKGLVTRDIAQAAIRAAGEKRIVSSANPKPRTLSHFEGASAITLNQSEAAAASGIEIDGVTRLEKAGKKLLASTQSAGLLITRGAAGLSVFQASGDIAHIPAVESEVYDVAGAGDTVVSALTMALASGLDLVNAAAIANCAGGAVVRKVGVAVTSVDEILGLFDST